MRNKISFKKSITISIVLTLVFNAGVCFAAGNLLNDNGFEQSEPNGGFPDSGSWKGLWQGFAGAGCTTSSARTGDNGLWQFSGLASDSQSSQVYQDVASWPGRIFA